MKKIFSLLAVAFLPFGVSAQTFDSFMSAVEKHNSGYLAEKYNIDIAEANTQAAKVFNDPELSVEYGDNQDRVLMMGRSLEAGLSYSFNLGNPRKARISERADAAKACCAPERRFLIFTVPASISVEPLMEIKGIAFLSA